MKVLNIALCGVLSVSIGSFLLLREPSPVTVAEALSSNEIQWTPSESMEPVQALEVSEPQQELILETAQHKVSPEAEPPAFRRART